MWPIIQQMMDVRNIKLQIIFVVLYKFKFYVLIVINDKAYKKNCLQKK